MGFGTTIVVAKHPQKGQSADDCKQMAESGMGAFSYDAFGTACWSIYGKAIAIQELKDSIMVGFQITNLNFNASSAANPVQTSDSLPGPTSDSLQNGLMPNTPLTGQNFGPIATGA